MGMSGMSFQETGMATFKNTSQFILQTFFHAIPNVGPVDIGSYKVSSSSLEQWDWQ
jgi:hypothetical protein